MTAYQLFDALPAAVEDALRASISRFGVLVPVVTDQHGTVIDGHHRARIAAELGVDHRTDVVTVASDDEAREVAITLNADRRQLDPDQRREAGAALRAAGHSERAIAAALGVSQPTVHRDLAGDSRESPAAPSGPERVQGTDGKSYPASRPAPRAEPEEEAEWSDVGEVGAYDARGEFHHRPPESPFDLEPFDRDAGREAIADEWLAEWSEYAAETGDRPPDNVSRLLHQSTDNEWYTPAVYLDAARAVLGGFDLDPASSATANDAVRAIGYYTADDDGLDPRNPWKGRLWVNPPYGGASGPFTARLLAEHDVGNVEAAVLLVNANSTETRWFQPLWNHVLCFTDHRINFTSPSSDGASGSTHGSVFAYLGRDPAAFVAAFARFGAVVTRWA